MKKRDVLKYFGGDCHAVARLVEAMCEAGYEISTQAVYKWGAEVPPLRAYQLEQLTDGKVKR